jgi:hypothetical protein
LDTWIENSVNINLEILSLITHFSNGYRKRKHFSPSDVRAKRQRDQRLALRKKLETGEGDKTYLELAKEAMDQQGEQEAVFLEREANFQRDLDESEFKELVAQDEISKLEEKLNKEKFKNEALSHQLTNASTTVSAVDPEFLFRLASGSPTPAVLLDVVQNSFPARVAVLDTAHESAKQSQTFEHVERLSTLLRRLCTDYYDELERGGDSKARNVFTNHEFAAQESETVQNSEVLRSHRTFKYRNEQVCMLRHLKIGVANTVETTIRVHFHWDSEKKRIVIGHCGPHLPLA